MELIIMLLTPFPLGYLIRNRMAAYLAYVALHSFVFTGPVPSADARPSPLSISPK